MRLKCSEDPSLIAGMIIRTPDAVLDASYQGKLERMKEQLLKS
ncbi:F0F1 ATP synthase subunit delta [Allobaculum sp. Allo2]|nr:F0F1 ATP synthase subunit delta [Allobaculum sp. Allo2]